MNKCDLDTSVAHAKQYRTPLLYHLNTTSDKIQQMQQIKHQY